MELSWGISLGVLFFCGFSEVCMGLASILGIRGV